jgi:hypothetical protein
MIRTLGKLFSQGLLLLGPMLTLNWSFLNFLGYSGGPSDIVTLNVFFIPLTGQKQQVEMTLRIIASLVGLVVLISYEIMDTVLPRRNLTEFRTIYLEQEKLTWRKEPDGLIKQVRINIMHVRRPWYTLFLGRFYWTWNDGFDPPDQKDANMLLLTFQGVAGAAYRAKEPQGVDFRELPPGKVRFDDYRKYLAAGVSAVIILGAIYGLSRGKFPGISFFSAGIVVIVIFIAIGILRAEQFRLWPWQAKKTAPVKYILSVPLFKASKGDSRTWKPVGVINLDSTTEEGAAFLQANEGRLAAYFIEIGKVIACLR